MELARHHKSQQGGSYDHEQSQRHLAEKRCLEDICFALKGHDISRRYPCTVSDLGNLLGQFSCDPAVVQYIHSFAHACKRQSKLRSVLGDATRRRQEVWMSGGPAR